jgi:hypothetical protein
MHILSEPGVWGLTRSFDIVHYFRKRKPRNAKKYADMTIHPTSKGGGYAYLFVPRLDWNPQHPLTCPECLLALEFERREEQGNKTLNPSDIP